MIAAPVINPHIVKGMTLGGIAHGLGAALLEEFVYDDEGHLITQSFMDYLLPSSHEVPEVEIVHHCTPSPHTVFGQKGSGESGYLGAPAAICRARSTIASRRSAFPSTSFRSVFPPSAMRSRTHNRANRKSKPHDHRLSRPSRAAEPAGCHPRPGRKLSVDPADRGGRQPRIFVRRRQADAAGVEAAERHAGAAEMDGRAKDRTPGGRRLARHVRL